ncbi:DNA polymerase beta [Dermatophagoides farinae]|uniref:DNA polymerase beta n=1 Tax=Dermatophagoides farinae TaxID=6954 RepID=UPI003F5FCE8B
MSDNPNKDICDMLIKLGEHERDVNGIIYKYHAYRKAAKALEAYGKRVESGAEAQKLSGIGPKIAAKINDFLQNGCDEDIQGIKTIGDLRNNITIAELNEAQQICLEHYDDLRLKISQIEICGQFRRRIEECDKIDVLIIDMKTKSTDSDAERKLKKSMKIIGKTLLAEHIIKKSLALDGSYFAGIVNLEQSSPYRLMNLHVVPKDQYVGVLFHLTGSEQFWERIRLHCINQGFILSSRTLCRIGQTLVPGLPIKIKSEEELFDYIEYPYVEPKDRQ